MDKTEVQEILNIYRKFSLTMPIKLYVIVRSTEYTAHTQGMGDYMKEFLNVPLEVKEIRSNLSFILIIPDRFNYDHRLLSYFYDYRDIEPTEDTKKLIKALSIPKKISQTTSKFDVKNIYNFKEDNRQK